MTAAARLLVEGLREALEDREARAEILGLLEELLPHPEPPADRLLYTVASLSQELGVSERTIRRAIAEGALPATRRVGRWVMTAEGVRAWATTGAAVTTRPRRAPAKRKGVLAAVLKDLDL